MRRARCRVWREGRWEGFTVTITITITRKLQCYYDITVLKTFFPCFVSHKMCIWHPCLLIVFQKSLIVVLSLVITHPKEKIIFLKVLKMLSAWGLRKGGWKLKQKLHPLKFFSLPWCSRWELAGVLLYLRLNWCKLVQLRKRVFFNL